MERKNTLDIYDFVLLLLATLAQNSRIIMLEDKNKKVVSLPVQYKQIIQNILCADNNWREKFSILIDTEEYFKDHFMWEQKLSLALKKVLSDFNKTCVYDFEDDKISIFLTPNEINKILFLYQDEELKSTMDHFANLLVDYIYTREFQEKYHDYYASSVSKMHNLMFAQNDAEDLDDTMEKSNTKVRK